jgi:hypothetical protein
MIVVLLCARLLILVYASWERCVKGGEDVVYEATSQKKMLEKFKRKMVTKRCQSVPMSSSPGPEKCIEKGWRA